MAPVAFRRLAAAVPCRRGTAARAPAAVLASVPCSNMQHHAAPCSTCVLRSTQRTADRIGCRRPTAAGVDNVQRCVCVQAERGGLTRRYESGFGWVLSVGAQNDRRKLACGSSRRVVGPHCAVDTAGWRPNLCIGMQWSIVAGNVAAHPRQVKRVRYPALSSIVPLDPSTLTSPRLYH